MKSLQFGITARGVMHTDTEPPFNVETRFRIVKKDGVCDLQAGARPVGG